MKKLLILLALLPFAACSDDDDANTTACSTEIAVGLRITVTDAGAAVGEGITVTATDGEYIEELEYLENAQVYEGADERAGTYIITITGEGFAPYTSEPITVTENECHVITQEATIDLEPAD
jgi:hypothetical protein